MLSNIKQSQSTSPQNNTLTHALACSHTLNKFGYIKPTPTTLPNNLCHTYLNHPQKQDNHTIQWNIQSPIPPINTSQPTTIMTPLSHEDIPYRDDILDLDVYSQNIG